MHNNTGINADVANTLVTYATAMQQDLANQMASIPEDPTPQEARAAINTLGAYVFMLTGLIAATASGGNLQWVTAPIADDTALAQYLAERKAKREQE